MPYRPGPHDPRILAILSTPQTAAAIATALGIAHGSIHYHLQRLLVAGRVRHQGRLWTAMAPATGGAFPSSPAAPGVMLQAASRPGAHDAEVLAVLTTPRSNAAIAAKLGLGTSSVTYILKRLARAKQVRQDGRLWVAVGAIPPAPPVPVASSAPVTRPKPNTPELETVWDGTRDAPSLLGTRAQKAAS